jgi:hypothetical protein
MACPAREACLDCEDGRNRVQPLARLDGGDLWLCNINGGKRGAAMTPPKSVLNL